MSDDNDDDEVSTIITIIIQSTYIQTNIDTMDYISLPKNNLFKHRLSERLSAKAKAQLKPNLL